MPTVSGGELHEAFPSSQTHIYVGQSGMSRHDPDYFALYVGNHVLGGGSLVSTLGEEVRNKRGLSYSVYSYFSPMRVDGPFLMVAQTKNDQAEQALKVMRDTLERFVEDGPSEGELEAAKQNERMAKSQVSEARGRLDQSTPIDSRIAVAKAQATLAHARVKSATAALELAKLQLSYTRIEAPADGIVSRLSVHVGQLVQPGQPIAEFVPTATYVVANFKETQIARIKAGDRAVVELDAFPGREFEGTVESLSAATGARFSLIPPDNASGNFVKVVQRVPVRVHWKGDPGDIMRAGLSAEVTVHVK